MAAPMMDDRELAARFEFAAGLAQEAAALALGRFRRLDTLTITDKGRQDMATEADLETEILIRARLAERFPGDAFLGEETGRTDVAGSENVWVVDPIDGTQPFICGMTSWCVSIALVSHGALEMGLVVAPARDELLRRSPRGRSHPQWPAHRRSPGDPDRRWHPLHGVLTADRRR